MTWIELDAHVRADRRCASKGCAGQPAYRLEAGGVGSDYCQRCRDKIEHRSKPVDITERLRSRHEATFLDETAAREIEVLRVLLSAYVSDEDRYNAGQGEPYGSISTEIGMRARLLVKCN